MSFDGIKIYTERWKLCREAYSKYEELLASVKKDLDELENSLIPNALMTAGINNMTLDDGTSIKIERFLNPKIQPGAEVEAFEFLEKMGYGSVIKTEFKFNKGEDLGEIEGFLAEMGVSYEKDLNIHYQTLRKTIREIVDHAEQSNPDVDIRDVIPSSIAVETFNKANIKPGKA